MIRRREFIAGLAGAAASPLAANAQQGAVPVVGVIGLGTDAGITSERFSAAFRKGLSETGYVEGENVTVEYHRLEDQSDRLPALMDNLVRRRIAVIVTGNTLTSLAAKNATALIPIVFASGQDPVQLGLIASLARPGGNATGINFFNGEVAAKRLGLLHQLVPKAVRVVLLLNPANVAIAETISRDVQEAARVMGLQIQTLNAATIGEIDAALATIVRERPDALLVAGDPFFGGRYEALATLAVRERIPGAYAARDSVVVGGLMSYGTADTSRQMGIYVGSILKGAKPADLPVVQPTRFEFVINLHTARALGIEVPPMLLALTDEVIE